MVLSYKELRKRDVVNIADGRSFGKITDLKLDFPRADLKGIVVCEGRRNGLFGFLFKNEIFIDEKNIVRIGGDVILVNIKNCAAITPTSVEVNGKEVQGKGEYAPQKKPSPPMPCPPPFPSPCPPPVNPCRVDGGEEFFGENIRMDLEDY